MVNKIMLNIIHRNYKLYGVDLPDIEPYIDNSTDIYIEISFNDIEYSYDE